jgi:hypothetical protein
MLFEFYLMDLVNQGDKTKMMEVIRSDEYSFDKGQMALSLALRKNKEIAFEMLSLPGAWDHYVKSQFSPFIVLDKLEQEVLEYKRCNGYQN